MQFAISWYLKILSSQGSYTQKLASVSVMNPQDRMIDMLGGAWVETRKEKCYSMDQRASCCHSQCLLPLCHLCLPKGSPGVLYQEPKRPPVFHPRRLVPSAGKFSSQLVLFLLSNSRKIEAENTKFLLPHSVAQTSLTVTILLPRLSFYRCPLRHLTPHATHIFLCYGKRLREEVDLPQPPVG